MMKLSKYINLKMKAILTEHLTKFYGKARGINDVNLSVEQGDFFGFGDAGREKQEESKEQFFHSIGIWG